MLVASCPEHFARGMVLLHENPDLAGRLVQGGREALQKRHDPARIVAQLEAVYERAITRKGARGN